MAGGKSLGDQRMSDLLRATQRNQSETRPQLVNSRDGKLTSQQDDETTSEQVNSLASLLTNEFEGWLARESKGERFSVGARIYKRLWHIVNLYCVEEGITRQEFLEEAIINEMRRRLR